MILGSSTAVGPAKSSIDQTLAYVGGFFVGSDMLFVIHAVAARPRVQCVVHVAYVTSHDAFECLDDGDSVGWLRRRLH